MFNLFGRLFGARPPRTLTVSEAWQRLKSYEFPKQLALKVMKETGWDEARTAATLEEYEGVGGAFTNVVTVPFAQPFAPRVFPGLTIDLASLP